MALCDPSILIFGDSNTWGHNPNSTSLANIRFAWEDRWTTQLDTWLNRKWRILTEGLNGRTTVFDDVRGLPGYEANRNGSAILPTLLFTHKPLEAVVLALGTNDLRTNFNTTPKDVVNGVKTLVDIIKSSSSEIGFVSALKTTGSGSDAKSGSKSSESRAIVLTPPKILVLGPPVIHQNKENKLWGIGNDVSSKSKEVSRLLAIACEEWDVGFINLGQVAKVSEQDGVHFPLSAQKPIAEAVAQKLTFMLKT